ncbi:MAG: TolC family protein [Pseudomonadota bacterium]
MKTSCVGRVVALPRLGMVLAIWMACAAGLSAGAVQSATADAGSPGIIDISAPGQATNIPTAENDVGPTLLLSTVLDRSATHFPAILEALAKRRAAEGTLQASRGAFDLVFEADGYDRVTGFWTGQIVNTNVTKQLRPFGARVYGGYRRSNGFFPIYEDINFTNDGGEFKIGGLFSLLRDRKIDDRRFGERDAALTIAEQDFEVLLTRVGVQHKALLAYWRWVAAGHQLDVYEELLALARTRQSGLDEQVRQGARAAIFLTENRQNLLRRERLTADAGRTLDLAANRLSFYLRDRSGYPILPRRDQLPSRALWQEFLDEIAQAGGAQGLLAADAIPAILNQRPELSILRVALNRADLKVTLGENELKPRFDLSAEVSRDVGAIAEGGVSRDSTDTIIGFRFSVPLERREARGKINRAKAERESLRQQRRLKQDEIEIELREILINLTVAGQLASLAQDEVVQARTMQEAERIRFRSGASDFFLVNIREEAAADAQIRYFLAALETNIARANFDAATINLDRLGLE